MELEKVEVPVPPTEIRLDAYRLVEVALVMVALPPIVRPPTIVVDAFWKILVPENKLLPEKILESPNNVDEAEVPEEVSTQTKPFESVLRVPTVVVDRVRKPARRLVVEAVRNEEYTVDDE